MSADYSSVSILPCEHDEKCENVALAYVEDRAFCGDHLRHHSAFAYPPGSYAKEQAAMNAERDKRALA